MGEVDVDALLTSSKALTIIFIILIVIINVGLIFKLARMPRFLFCAKKLTLISLAFGDIFLALFSLVVAAISYFDPQSFADMECSTRYTASVYHSFLLNFVYGTGLVTLAIELIVRFNRPRSQSTTSSFGNIVAFVVSAIPWLLGLIIILPLTMAGMDWDNCVLESTTLSRAKAWYGVSICLPACAALLAGILLMFTVTSSRSSHTALSLSEMPQQNPTYHYNHDPSRAGYDKNSYPQASNPYPSQPYAHNNPNPPQYPGSYPPQYPASSYPPQYPASSYPPQSQQTYMPEPQSSPQTGSVNYDREKNTLMFVCIVYFFCIIPFAGLKLGYDLDTDRTTMDSLAYTVLTTLFYWLMVCRSALTPAIWIIFLRE